MKVPHNTKSKILIKNRKTLENKGFSLWITSPLFTFYEKIIFLYCVDNFANFIKLWIIFTLFWFYLQKNLHFIHKQTFFFTMQKKLSTLCMRL